MNATQYQVYDFASSARVERPLWLAFHNWIEKSADLFVEQWKNFSPTPIECAPLGIDAHEFESLQLKWNTPHYGVELGFNENATTGMLLLERVELIRLMMDILGDTSDTEITDRSLTTIESSLCNLIFEQSASVLAQSWPEQQSLTFKIGPPDSQPNRSRMFASDKKLLTTGLQIQISGSTVKLQLLLAKHETGKLLGIDTQTKPTNPDNKISPEKIAELTVQVTAGLGVSELGMNDLVSISAGDIIVLNQPIEEPLTVYANDQPVFRAWPGRIKQQQVLNIESPFN